jgi:hypothetical protein
MLSCAVLALSGCGGGSSDDGGGTPAPAPGPGPECAALHSGTYRLIAPHYGDLDAQLRTATLDASTLRYSEAAGDTDTWAATGSACRFTGRNGDANKTDIVVSSGGVIIARYFADDGNYRVAIGFPEQSHALAELAGTWNMLGVEHDAGNSLASAHYHGVAAAATLTASGQLTGAQFCDNVSDCVGAPSSVALQPNAAGGFDAVDTSDHTTSRCFAYQANGELMMACIDGDGSLAIWTRQRTDGVSAVGSVSSTWGMWMNTFGLSTAATSDNRYTTTASDEAAGTWTRQSDADGHLETLQANAPRNGYTHRAPATATTTTGATVAVNEFTALGLRGMGMSVLWLPGIGLGSAPGAYFFSVQKP